MAEVSPYITHLFLEFMGSLILGFGLNILRVTNFVTAISGTAVSLTSGYFILPFFAIGAVASCYRVTGANLNPAITLANIFRRDKPENFDKLLAVLYIVAQYAGFFLAVLLGWLFRENPGDLLIERKPEGGDNWFYSEAIGMELFASFAFVLIYLNQTSEKVWLSSETGIQALLISLAYGSLVAWSHERTGGSVNPAYAFAQNFWNEAKEGDEDAFKFIWIYTLMPIIGSFSALGLHEFVVKPGHEETKDEVDIK